MNFSLDCWLIKNNLTTHKKEYFSYKLSQYLIFSTYKLRNGNIHLDEFEKIVENYKDNITIAQRVYNQYLRDISIFFDEIRNYINHGTSIQKKENVTHNVLQLLECIRKLGRS